MRFLEAWSNDIARKEKQCYRAIYLTESGGSYATIELLRKVREEEDEWWELLKEVMQIK